MTTEKHPSKKLEIIFLAGAGAVGKTSVAAELDALAARLNSGYYLTRTASTTRETYKRLGINSERDYVSNLPEAKKIELQNAIYEDYEANLLDNVVRAQRILSEDSDLNRRHILVVDRSPYDHATYLWQSIPTLDLETVSKRAEAVSRLMNLLATTSWVESTMHKGTIRVEQRLTIWFFEYPTRWMVQDVGTDHHADGFRISSASRNLIWSLALESCIRNAELKDSAIRVHKFGTRDPMTAQSRAHSILSKMVQDGFFCGD